MAAIKPEICIQIESDASKFTITDDTGIADANNLNGYGPDNNVRADYAGMLIAYYQPYESPKTLLTDLSTDYIKADINYTDEEKSVFTLPFHKDGWYELSYILIPTIASGLVTPALDEIVYDTASDEIVKYDGALNLVPVNETDFEDILNPSLFQLTTEIKVYTPKLKIQLNSLIRNYFACKQCIDCGCDEEYDYVLYLREGIQSLISQFEISRYEAQRMVERLTKQYKIK